MPHDDLIAKARAQADRLRKSTTSKREQDAHRVAGLRDQLVERYEFLGEIHRGGQGVVYRARQRGADRLVAIKVLHGGVLGLQASDVSLTAQARFQREIRILAGLRHANIVSIHDSGVAGGAFYYVMDLVEGQPLDQYVQQHGLSVDATAALFIKVAGAVHAAHLRGIIHRDLKPGNILVTPAGEPMVLDFGLAKLTEDEDNSSAAAVMTRTGQFLGSLPWASPEQAEGDSDRTDLRSDVYSLGVLLFGALTDRFPYDVEGTTRTVLTNIVEKMPAPPSTLQTGIRRDLDTIVLKCLSKQPERRYQAAGDLAADLQRYRDGEAIDARRDSASYVLRMQLRRYRVPVTIGLAFVAVILAGLVSSLRFWQQAVDERETARNEAASAAQAAERAQAVTDFLTQMLTAVDPAVALDNRDVTVREVLDQAAEDANQFEADPDLEATVRTAIGEAYAALGILPEARTHLARAVQLSEDLAVPALLAERRDALATLLQKMGRFPEAIALFEQSHAGAAEVFGEEHEQTLMAGNNLALALLQSGSSERARELLDRAMAGIGTVLPADSAEAAQLYSNYGGLLVQLGDLTAAEAHWRQAYELRREILAPGHPGLSESLNNLGMLLTEIGQFDEAERLLREGLAGDEETFGPDHPHIAYALNNLANVLDNQGRFDEAEPIHRRALAIRIASLGDEHQLCTATRCNLALNLRAQGRTADALAVSEAALSGRWPMGPEFGPRELLEFFHATALAELGREEEALRILSDLPERLTANGRAEQAAQAKAMRDMLQP